MDKKGLVIIKGGSWYVDDWLCRSAYRLWLQRDYSNNLRGFRIVLKKKTDD